jgi:hypothetical protein
LQRKFFLNSDVRVAPEREGQLGFSAGYPFPLLVITLAFDGPSTRLAQSSERT